MHMKSTHITPVDIAAYMDQGDSQRTFAASVASSFPLFTRNRAHSSDLFPIGIIFVG